MYSRLKKVMVAATFLLISLIGILFIQSHASEIFGGYRQVIVVEKSTVDFAQDIRKFARENELVLARRIVDPANNKTGKLHNTYEPIGDTTLPKVLVQQKDRELIENSSYNTVYVIVSGKMNAEEVAKELSKNSNVVRVLPTNYETALLRLILTMPQSLLIIIGFVIAYASLILTEYISGMKEIGIRRISGEGKHSIALKQTYQDGLFIALTLFVSILGIVGVLFTLQAFSLLAVVIVVLPAIVWTILLLVVNFLLSHLFYYILQHQPIILSIKGRAPVGLVFVVVLLTQMITLFSIMFCMHGMTALNQDLNSLHRGKSEWKKFANYYSLTSLEDGGSVTQQQRSDFFNELIQKSNILYREDTLDNIATLKTKDNSPQYSPTADSTSNVLHVNEAYIKQSGIALPEQAMAFMREMKTHDKMILIPKIQAANFDNLVEQWTYFKERGFLPKDAEFNNLHPDAKVKAYLYEGGEVFSYPVYALTSRLFSIVSFISDPIVIVEKPVYQSLSPWTLLIDNPDHVVDLIRKHKLTAAYGSLTNGLVSIEMKIQDTLIKKYLLLGSTSLSGIVSLLLFILMNTIYFYQGRRTYFIERLAGKSLLRIHQGYLGIVSSIYLVISFGSFIAGLALPVIVVPIVYLGVLLIIFSYQLAREKKVNILYLKGE